MAVPYTFSTATGSLPLSQLDSNFSTAITIGNTAVVLGDSITTINNLTLGNVAITSVSTAFPNGYLANSNVIVGTTTLTLGSTVTSINGLSLSNVTISSGNVTISNVTTTNVTATTANVTTANVGTLVVIGDATVGGNTTVTGNITAAKGTFTSANVSGTANVSTLAVVINATVGGNATVTGNVGIGTSSPETKLHIKSASTSLYSTVIAANKSLTGFGTVNYTVTDISTDGTFAANQWLVTRNGGVEQYAYMGAVANSAGFAPDIVFGQRTAAAAMTERMRIDSSGNVGIGTASPVRKLDVRNTSADYQLHLGDSASTTLGYELGRENTAGLFKFYGNQTGATGYIFSGVDNERMRIDTSGNVGIGTSSPTAKLQVYDATSAILQVDGDVASAVRPTRYSTDTNGPVFQARKARGTFASPTAVASGDTVANFQASAYGGTSYRAVGLINAVVDTYTSDTNISGYLTFQTNSGSIATAERMRIDAVGNAQFQAGAVMPYAPAPAAISAATTLTNANIQGQIISATGTTYTITMPLGSTMETLATWATTNIAYDFFVINTASGTITMAVNTGVTSLGTLTIATGVSAQFRIRRTAANTYILYRLS
jgi:hypothetical protein